MRIARLVQYFQPQFGYAEYYLMTEFLRLGHEVCIITSDRYSPGIKSFDSSIDSNRRTGKLIESGLTVYRLPTVFEKDQIVISQNLSRALNDFEPDIVHSNDLFYLPTIMSIFYKKQVDFKLFVDSITGTFNPSGFSMIAFDAFKVLFKRYLRSNVDGFFAISEGSKKWLNKNFGIPYDSINRIPLGADSTLFAPSDQMRKIMRKAFSLTDEILLIYTGKLIPGKDVDILIKAIAQIRNCNFKIKLILIGNGPSKYLLYLKRVAFLYGVKEKIIFVPTVHRTDLPKYYNAADIAIWPGNPSISIIEAMASGLPIVIAGYAKGKQDAYDTTHLIKNGNGFLFERGSVSELASCIKRLVENPQLRKEMSRQSIEYVKTELNWGVIAAKYFESYNKNYLGDSVQ